jgi:hypothetical protein
VQGSASVGDTAEGTLAATPRALQASLCVLVLDRLRALGFSVPAVKTVVEKLGVARSHAYETARRIAPRVERLLADDDIVAAATAATQQSSELDLLRIRNAVLEHRIAHPGGWIEGGRTTYGDALTTLVLELGQRYGLGRAITQAEFAAATGIPLGTLKDWWAAASVSPSTTPPPEGAAEPDEGAAEPASSNVTTTPDAAEPAAAMDVVGLSADMLTIVRAYESWRGSMPAFVEYLRTTHRLHYGRQMVTQVLHLAAARKILRRPPPPLPARGSTFRPPAGIQWTSDGKQFDVLVDGVLFTVNWQPMVDVGSAAFVGSVVREEEDTAGVVASFIDGVYTTGAAAAALLLDNKACNHSDVVTEAVAPGTFVMHATIGRPQNKAVIEGAFGLFAQELGSIAAVVDTSSPDRAALDVAEAVARAYALGRNGRPRRRDGRSPAQLYREAQPTEEQQKSAIDHLAAVKQRNESRAAREAARCDPAVAAALEQACARFGFSDDGDIVPSLRTLPLEPIQSAIAIYAAKLDAAALPLDAGLRYFAGIARNCQHERELLFFELELVQQLAGAGRLTLDHLERRAASMANLESAAHCTAIVDELLACPAPIAQAFWRRRLAEVTGSVPPALRPAVRSALCRRVRKRYIVTKQRRHELVDLVVRLLSPVAATA